MTSSDRDRVCGVGADNTHREDSSNGGRSGEGKQSKQHSKDGTENDGHDWCLGVRVEVVQPAREGEGTVTGEGENLARCGDKLFYKVSGSSA